MYSLVIKNVRIMDGLGNPWTYGDVGIKGDKIVHIGKVETKDAEKTIDGNKMILAPGFIDMHSHAELIFLGERQPELIEGRIQDNSLKASIALSSMVGSYWKVET